MMNRTWMIAAALALVLCTSCATQKWGIYDVLHRQRFADDYEALLLQHGDSLRFQVTYKGQPICETEVDPTEVRSVASPYKVRGSEDLDSITVLCDGKIITTARWITDGTNKVFIVDRDGDGFPEMRQTVTPTGRTHESVKPLFAVEKGKPVELTSPGDVLKAAQEK